MNFGQKHFLMNILNEAAPAGGSAPEAAPAPAASGAATDVAPFVAPEWAKGLNVDEEILRAPMFSSVKDINDVVKGYYHAQKMVGADKVVVPGKHATPEEWKAYYIKAGLPASLDEYKPELPQSLDNQEFNKALIAKAYELNIRPDQLSEIVKEMDVYNSQIVEDYEKTQAAEIAQTAETLKKEWGADYQRNLVQAQRVIKHFGGDEMLQAVLESDLANNGNFLRLMAKIGGQVTKEDTFSQDVVTSFGMSAEEARRKINDIYSNPSHAYFDDMSPKHKDAIAEMLKYQQIVAERA